MIDVTGLHAAAEVIETLRARGITFIAAGRETEWRQRAEKRHIRAGCRSFPTLRAALKGYKQETVPLVTPG
jgi:hypothetical protein